MAIDYSNMTAEEEFEILAQIMEKEGVRNILMIGGVYEVLSEYFNNEVLDIYAETQEEE